MEGEHTPAENVQLLNHKMDGKQQCAYFINAREYSRVFYCVIKHNVFIESRFQRREKNCVVQTTVLCMSMCFIQSIWLENYLICVTVYDAYLKIHIPFDVCTQKVLSLSAPLHSRTTSPVDFRRTYCFVMLAVYSIFFEWTSHIVDNVCSRSATYHVAYTFFLLLLFFLLRLMHMSIYFLSVYS